MRSVLRLAVLGLVVLACLGSPARSPRAVGLPPAIAAGSLQPGGADEIVFQRGTLDFTTEQPASLAFGPEGRLYVASEMEINALTLDPVTKEVLGVERIASGLPTLSGLQGVLGLAFDPDAAAAPVTLYASSQDPNATPGYTGVVSTFTAPDWQRQDIITGLPSSVPHTNHMTNGLAFGKDGRLYIAQGSSTDAGIIDPPGSQFYWNETPLSAAILVADIHDAGFDGAITYDPAGTPADDNVDLASGDVAVYAAGLRNPYDLVWHSNGHLYATDNGAMAEQVSLSCTEAGGTSSTADELNLIEPGNYYGHPNRNRGRADPRQCTYRSPLAGSGQGYTGPIAVLPSHCSCDGLAEYTADAFGGALQGDLIYAEWSRGNVSRAELSPDGRSVLSTSTLDSRFSNPLDVTVGDDGTIYIAEFGADRIAYLAPDSDGDGCSDSRELGPDPTLGGRRDPNNPYDFYDVNGDGIITAGGDILPVMQAFGPATGTNYSAAKDRSPAPPGGDPWDLGPPDGAVNVLDDILGVISQFGHTCAPTASLAGSWSAGASMPTARTEVTSAQIDGVIYVIGGFRAAGGNSEVVEAYDTAADSWSTKAPLPQRLDHAGAATVGGKVYVAGGYTSLAQGTISPATYEYDPATDSWTARAPMPLPRAAAATVAVGGTIYVLGGVGPSPTVPLAYDPTTNAWTRLAPMSAAREHLTASVAGGSIYVIGGRQNTVQNVNTAAVYDPVTNSWQTLSPMPTARGGLASGALAGRVHVVGGEDLSPGGSTFAEHEVYLPESDSWATAPDLPTARHGLTAQVVGDALYVIGGGLTPGLSVSNVVEFFRLS